MTQPIILPSIVTARWAEAEANPSISRWHALTQMLSSMVVNASVYAPHSPMVDELRKKAHQAHRNMLDLQLQGEPA